MSATLMPSTTTTVPYLSVPPSYSTLDPFQRARLIHTTRKLGRVLGTTPILREPLPSTSSSERIALPIGPKSLATTRTRSPSPAFSDTSSYRSSKKSRRQGSLFEVQVPLLQNAEANCSTSSLSSLSSLSSSMTTRSLPESRSFAVAANANRRRNVDVPTPLKLTTFASTSTSVSERRAGGGGGGTATAAVKSTEAEIKLDVRTLPQPLDHIDATPARMGMAPDALIRAQQEHRRARSSSAASTATTATGISTPLTPSFRLRAAANPSHRRDVLHKLERTLGEPVPPSLVFSADTLRRAQAAAAASASDSSLSLPLSVSSSAASTTSNTTAPSSKPRPVSPPTVGDVQLRSPSLDIPRDIKTQTRYIAGPVRRSSSTLVSAGSTRASRRRSASVHGLLQVEMTKARNPRGSSHWQAPEEWEMGPSSRPASSLSSEYVQVEKQDKREGEDGKDEDECLGIWNAENYENVMKRLRSLRA